MASILKVNEIQHTGGTTALTVDSSGRILQPQKPAFRAYRTSSWVIPTTTWTDFAAQATIFNYGNNYDSGTGRFTAPVTGLYWFHAQWFGSVAPNRGIAALYVNGTQSGSGRGVQTLYLGSTSNGGITYAATGLINLTAAEYVNFMTYQESGGNVTANNSNYLSYWCGYLVS